MNKTAKVIASSSKYKEDDNINSLLQVDVLEFGRLTKNIPDLPQNTLTVWNKRERGEKKYISYRKSTNESKWEMKSTGNKATRI